LSRSKRALPPPGTRKDWEWHELIGPLAADGYRVVCPDLRGAGWSSAPKDRYLKNDMADDLAAVLDRLGVGPVRLVAHDWGGAAAFIMMLRYPQKVTGFFGVNTIAPLGTLDLAMVRHLWRFWYQILMALPVIGPRAIGDPKGRYLRMLLRWVGAGFSPAEGLNLAGTRTIPATCGSNPMHPKTRKMASNRGCMSLSAKAECHSLRRRKP